MTATTGFYRGMLRDALTGTAVDIGAAGDDIYIEIHTSSATNDLTADETISTGTLDELAASGGYKDTGEGYNAKGVPLVSPTLTLVGGELVWDAAACADLTNQTWTADSLFFFDDDVGSDRLIAAMNVGTMSPSGGTITLDWHTNGIYRIKSPA